VLREALGRLPRRGGGCACGDALRDAIITARDSITVETSERLRPILDRYLDPPS
jgi:hypothetical protein